MEKLCYVVITRVSDFIASIDHAVRHMKRPAARNRDHPQLVQKLVCSHNSQPLDLMNAEVRSSIVT
jgi:hypothetical protein